jgi:zinc/manganese transport system substrate-binding protein
MPAAPTTGRPRVTVGGEAGAVPALARSARVGGFHPSVVRRMRHGGTAALSRSARVLTALGPCLAILASLLVAACGASPTSGTAALSVVAAENTWGSIAAQIGGRLVSVHSIVSDPAADPHEYQSTADDARAVASADYVIVNGAGYDAWATRLLAANPSPRRRVLDVASLVGRRVGENPHLFYDPDAVDRVVDRIANDYAALDPAHRADYLAGRDRMVAALGPYHQRIASIRQRYAGTPVAPTEDVADDLLLACGLRIVSPPDFTRAVSQGSEPPAQAVAAFQQLLDQHAAAVVVENVQTATASSDAIVQLARRQGIPVVEVTETLRPPTATFQEWQDAELDALARALAMAKGVSPSAP